MNEYKIYRHLIGKPETLPKDIDFSDLTDINGTNLPSTFNTAPTVIPINAIQKDNAGNILGTCSLFVVSNGVTSFNLDSDKSFKGADIYCSFFISGSPIINSIELPLNSLALRWYRVVQDRIDINNFNTNDLKYYLWEVEDYFNTAQDRVINLLDREVIQPILYFEQTDVDVDSNRQINLLSLDYDILNVSQGILDLKITDDENGYLNKIPLEQRRQMLKNMNLEESDYASLTWQYFEIKGSKASILGYNAENQTVDIWALREPTKCSLNSITDNTLNTNFEWDREIQEVILGYSLEDYTNKPEAYRLRKKAENMIEEKNSVTKRSDFPRYMEQHRGNSFWERDYGGNIINFSS